MWKQIDGFDGLYEVNDVGDVRSLGREIVSKTGQTYFLPGKVLKPNITKNGYLMVHLCKQGKRKAFYIHKLVAEAFIPNPSSLTVVNHKNGNKKECGAVNLEWTTYSLNNQHAYDTGLKGKGENQYNAKLTLRIVNDIRSNGKCDTYRNIGRKYGVSGATVRDVLLGKTWRTI